MPTLPKIFVALDVPTMAEAHQLISALHDIPEIGFKFGPALMRDLSGFLDHGLVPPSRLFLDFKFHDIPNTVAAAVKNLITGPGAPGPAVLTVHTSGGPEMLEAAANVIEKHNSPTLLTGITVLTSMKKAVCRYIYNRSVAEQVALELELAANHGCKAIVCAAPDLPGIRDNLAHLKAICPGIRASGAPLDDQSRTATPAEAVRYGASAIVCGRQFTGSPNPAAEARTTLLEMAKAA